MREILTYAIPSIFIVAFAAVAVAGVVERPIRPSVKSALISIGVLISSFVLLVVVVVAFWFTIGLEGC